MIFWLGLSPGPMLRRMEPSARNFIESVQGPAGDVQVADRERR